MTPETLTETLTETTTEMFMPTVRLVRPVHPLSRIITELCYECADDMGRAHYMGERVWKTSHRGVWTNRVRPYYWRYIPRLGWWTKVDYGPEMSFSEWMLSDYVQDRCPPDDVNDFTRKHVDTDEDGHSVISYSGYRG